MKSKINDCECMDYGAQKYIPTANHKITKSPVAKEQKADGELCVPSFELQMIIIIYWAG